MKELDLLKKDWKKNENSFTQISENEIYKMIHKKSSSIVKWILIISILEIMAWATLGLVSNTDSIYIKMNEPGFMQFAQLFTYLNYVVILVFIYQFYKNYIRISTTVSTKDLMKDILTTRKTVQYYVTYNLVIVALSLLIGVFLSINHSPEIASLQHQAASNNKVLMITVAVGIIMTLVFIGFFWLFYRLLYGILLRRLLTNYKELKKIDL